MVAVFSFPLFSFAAFLPSPSPSHSGSIFRLHSFKLSITRCLERLLLFEEERSSIEVLLCRASSTVTDEQIPSAEVATVFPGIVMEFFANTVVGVDEVILVEEEAISTAVTASESKKWALEVGTVSIVVSVSWFRIVASNVEGEAAF